MIVWDKHLTRTDDHHARGKINYITIVVTFVTQRWSVYTVEPVCSGHPWDTEVVCLCSGTCI